jgi:hypothetical protein
MSEMVDRVARAIFEARRIEDGFTSRSFGELSPSLKDRMRRDARAAIAAMREMIDEALK